MAGRASLAFLGQEDLALSGDPQVTYFIERYKGQTPFTQRLDKVQFQNGYITFGQETILLVPKDGDLITAFYLKVNFPTITQPSNNSLAPVLDSVGTLMLDFVELYVGNILIERLYGEYMELQFDLTVPTGKQGALQGLIGKSSSRTPTSLPNASYTIPIKFSSLKAGLPVCLFNDPVYVRFQFRPSSLFVVDSAANYTGINYSGPVISYAHVEYTYLSESELAFLKSKPITRLIEQVQREAFFAPVGISNVQFNVNFSNPTKELFFVIQNNSARGWDFSNTATATSLSSFGTGDQLFQLTLFFNTTERISQDVGSPLFLSTIQALEFHTRNPDRLFYTYSFSIDPEGDSPAGSVNLSRINNQILRINMNSSTDAREIRVYASSYNFLTFQDGKVFLEFPNAEVS